MAWDIAQWYSTHLACGLHCQHHKNIIVIQHNKMHARHILFLFMFALKILCACSYKYNQSTPWTCMKISFYYFLQIIYAASKKKCLRAMLPLHSIIPLSLMMITALHCLTIPLLLFMTPLCI